MASKDYTHLATAIIKEVGGRENVDSLIHCITRLRFYLKQDPTAEATATIKALDDVIDVRKAQGQYQVVIGPAVTDVYNAVIAQLGDEYADPEATAEAVAETSAAAGAVVTKPQRSLREQISAGINGLIGVITGSMSPIIGIIAASGLLKGGLAFIAAFAGQGAAKNVWFQLFSQAGDTVFYFLPVMVGFTAARRLGGDPIITVAIGAFLTLPWMVNNGAKFLTLFSIGGMKFTLVNYSYSIFPMILAAWLAKRLQDWLHRVLPTALHMIFIPLITLLAVGFTTVIITGPIIQNAAVGIGALINWLVGASGAIGGLVIGGLYQILVIFGLHWGVVPLVAQQISDPSIAQSPLNALISTTMVAQGAAVLAVSLKSRKASIRDIGFVAALSAFMSITEPAIYGINLRFKKVFVSGLIGSAVGGLVTGLMHGSMYGFTGSLIGFSSFFNPKNPGDLHSLYAFLLSSLAAIIVTMVLTWVWGYKDDDVADAAQAKPVMPK
ncbi:PTS glucose transporter subunit IIBC [Schleiferilactobacillus harbinensis]|uniref:PTS transporter subunit EIIC n=1 Tax=Schleiferilactobacillus harbinensis TaxID=304207 RepID=UPI0021A2C28F|nr:PTS transporter subunit EIIC [Schleiferilactobacillus harbinensis]MCT2909910.1 PTS glucose transporter subunit IIBC [Schleiferilactobacillus harbinensis]